MTVTLPHLNRVDQAAFVDLLGGIFEHSPWVAERAFARRPFSSIDALHATMVDVVRRATAAEQLALIRAHPNLATRVKLTQSSASEQAGAGLDRLNQDEFARFHELNRAYRERFGFPFIIAVRHHTKASILEAFARRLHHTPDAEREEALQQIAEIARFRLHDMIASN